MGPDNDEEEDDEDDVGDVTENGPDLVEGGVGVAGEGVDDEHVFDDAVETVGDAGEEAGGGADKPAKRAGFVITGVGGFLLGFLFVFFGFLFFSLTLFGRCGFWVGVNRGS